MMASKAATSQGPKVAKSQYLNCPPGLGGILSPLI